MKKFNISKTGTKISVFNFRLILGLFFVCFLNLHVEKLYAVDSGTSSAAKIPSTPSDVNDLVLQAKSASVEGKESFLSALSRPNSNSSPALGDAYMALLQNEDLDIRDAAVIACGNMNEQRAIPQIRKILVSLPRYSFESIMSKESYSEEYMHGEIAAETLAKLKDMQALPEILSRDTLAVSWSAIIPPYGASALPQVIEKARSHNAQIKSLAEQAIVSINDENAIPQLQSLLSDNDNSLRNTAVLALSQMNSPRAILGVEGIYSQLDDTGKAYFVEGCVNHCDHQTAIKYLNQYMTSSKRTAHKALVLINLASSMQSAAVPYLEGFLNDNDPGVREEAACQLARVTGRLYQYPENNTTRSLEDVCEHIKKLKQNK